MCVCVCVCVCVYPVLVYVRASCACLLRACGICVYVFVCALGGDSLCGNKRGVSFFPYLRPTV